VDLNPNSTFFSIPILSSHFTLYQKLFALSLLSITRLCEALINALYSIQLKACEEDPNPKPSCFLTPILLSWSLFDEVPLPYLFFLSPALANLGTRFYLRGVVLSHSKIFNFGLWVSFRMCSATFRVFREFSRFFLKLFSFSCELISFIWMALKYFSRVSNILFGLLYPELSSAIVGKFSDHRIIFSGV